MVHRARHRDRQSEIRFREHMLRQSAGFPSEQQPIVGAVADVVIGLAGMAAQCQQAPATGSLFSSEGLPVGMAVQMHPGPVIQAGSFQRAVTDLEAERFDQMQFRAGGCAAAGHIAGVGRDLRLEQHQPWHGQPPGTGCPRACRLRARPATTSQLSKACCISLCCRLPMRSRNNPPTAVGGTTPQPTSSHTSSTGAG